ncbi:MAG: flavodoxin family protein [Dysgonamonadaceae bacterium]|jgi:flavodoxin|nr:flavodoxin family protein [Dysgonamonadaceae bacterium]
MTNSIDVQAQEAANKPQKILVAYFSWSGNTTRIANVIRQQTGGDIFEIVPQTPYPKDYNECLDVARKEKKEQARPPLKAKVENMEQYEVVFVGYPNWWSSIPMPVATFMEAYDFKGKIIVPFCSHGGGGLAQTVTDLKKLCPNVPFVKPIAIAGNGRNSLSSDIKKWLQETGIVKQ